MKRVVIACQTVEKELRRVLPEDVGLEVLEQGLHRTPQKLKESLQQAIDSIDADEILLGYGLCGNGVVGLRSARARLVVPKVDDCIALLLGSFERYIEEFRREPGTYWFSAGWIEHGSDPYKEYLRSVEKWDEETARWVAGEMMKGYRRAVLIDTDACPVDQLRSYSQNFAHFFDLAYREMEGGDGLLEALVTPAVRDSRFVVVEPGEEITAEMFQAALGTVNG